MARDPPKRPPSLTNSLTISLNRDKFLRLTQFSALFCAWLLPRSKLAPGSVAFWRLLATQTALLRRLSRLGRNFEFFHNVIKIKQQDSFLYYTSVGRQLFLGSFLTWDAALALDFLGIYKLKNAKRIQREAARCWMMAILCNIMTQVYRLYRLQNHTSNGEQEASEEEDKKTM